jgi:hypothetical protein
MPATAPEQLRGPGRLDVAQRSTRKVTEELVLASDYHQFALIHKAYIRAGRIHRASSFWALDQWLKFHVRNALSVPFLRLVRLL